MKGKISDKLEQVLQDSDARVQLRRFLTSGKAGLVTVDGTAYRVATIANPDGISENKTGGVPVNPGRATAPER